MSSVNVHRNFDKKKNQKKPGLIGPQADVDTNKSTTSYKKSAENKYGRGKGESSLALTSVRDEIILLPNSGNGCTMTRT